MNSIQRTLFQKYIEIEKRNLDPTIWKVKIETTGYVLFRHKNAPFFMKTKLEPEMMHHMDDALRHQIVLFSTETKKHGAPHFPHAYKRYEFLYQEGSHVLKGSANVERAGKLRQTISISLFPFSNQSRLSDVDECTRRELVDIFKEIVMNNPSYRLHYVTGEYTWQLPFSMR